VHWQLHFVLENAATSRSKESTSGISGHRAAKRSVRIRAHRAASPDVRDECYAIEVAIYR